MNENLKKKTLVYLIKKFFYKSYKFSKHKTNYILYFGNKKLSINNIKFFNLNPDYLNIYYLFYSLIYLIIRLKLNRTNLLKYYYFLQIIDISPKIIISDEISKFSFFVKKKYPKIITIVFQSANYWNTHIDFAKIEFSNYRCDYFCLYNSFSKKFFENIAKNYLISGSLYNNSIKLNKVKNKHYDIMYISEFRYLTNNFKEDLKSPNHGNFGNVINAYNFKLISEYCKINNLRLVVALSSNRFDKKNLKVDKVKEIEFYKYYSSNFEISNLDSYKLSNQSKMIICNNSNLGIELLSRGQKVFFCCSNSFILKWHFMLNNEDLFWYNGQDKKTILKKIDFLFKYNDKKWIEFVNNLPNPLKFDQDNILLERLIKKIIV